MTFDEVKLHQKYDWQREGDENLINLIFNKPACDLNFDWMIDIWIRGNKILIQLVKIPVGFKAPLSNHYNHSWGIDRLHHESEFISQVTTRARIIGNLVSLWPMRSKANSWRMERLSMCVWERGRERESKHLVISWWFLFLSLDSLFTLFAVCRGHMASDCFDEVTCSCCLQSCHRLVNVHDSYWPTHQWPVIFPCLWPWAFMPISGNTRNFMCYPFFPFPLRLTTYYSLLF